MDLDDDQALTSAEVCDAAGITYRQLDYWIRRGYVSPSVQDAEGPGSLRLFSAADLEDVRKVAATLRRSRELRELLTSDRRP